MVRYSYLPITSKTLMNFTTDDDKLQDLYYQTSHVPTKPVKLDTDVSVTVDKDFDRTRECHIPFLKSSH
jgi:hypothetical protein